MTDEGGAGSRRATRYDGPTLTSRPLLAGGLLAAAFAFTQPACEASLEPECVGGDGTCDIHDLTPESGAFGRALLKVRCRESGVRKHAEGIVSGLGESPLQFERKQPIGELALSVGTPLVVAGFQPEIVETNPTCVRGEARDGHHAAFACLKKQIGEVGGECEVTKVVGTDLRLESVVCFASGDCHYPSVVHQDVQPRVLGAKLGREIFNRGETR